MIRPARQDDAPAICAIWNPEIRDTLVTFNSVEKTASDIEAMVTDKGDGFMVCEGPDDAILGFAFYGQFRGGVGYRHTAEHTIVLAPAARGQGAGRALMTHVCDHAAAAGYHSLFAGVSAGNPDGVRFHARMGFAEVARLQEVGRKFDRWIDLILMQKML